MPATNDLSERELEILRLVATGASNKEIAQQLYISANTVKVHLRNIFTKIEATSRTEAAMYAVNAGLVPGIVPENLEEVDETGEVAEAIEPATVQKPTTRTTALRMQRALTGAILLLIAVVMILGGLYVTGNLPTAAVQSAPTQSVTTASTRWKSLEPMPTARFGLALAAYDNKIYAIGGETADEVTGALERYNPSLNEWTALSPKPIPATDIAAGVIGGKLYVPGGRNQAGQVIDSMDIYDPKTDTWHSGARLPLAISGYALATFEGKLYLFGGWDGKRTLATTFEYDPESQTWSEKTRMPVSRMNAGAVAVSGAIFVIGGYDGKRPLSANYQYSPDKEGSGENPWEKRAPLPQGRYGMSLASIAEIIHLVGGVSDGDESLTPIEYLPSENIWRTFENPPIESWQNASMVAIETRLFIMGGKSGNRSLAQNLSYQAIFTIELPIIR